ncbi:peptide N-acetyl-beta-D-glucosaminyl asparaginase amidase A-domain-containing protein [Daedaleopsis nitida]|nr:peptide N-acetyl-beta-D-glucosaminyl asparaginase amidase A-domain-containing protein [Daedaleopsis nitida]
MARLGTVHLTYAHGHPLLQAACYMISSLACLCLVTTSDDTVAPLVDLQVYAPPVVPRLGSKCTVELLPPTEKACGTPGNWGAVTLKPTVYSNKIQYDRLSSLCLSHVEIWRHSSAEPMKTGTIWTSVKDVTHYSALFAKSVDLLMDFRNITSAYLALDGVLHVTLTGTFYAPTLLFPKPATSDLSLSISDLSPNQFRFFTIADDAGGTATVTVPRAAQQASVEIYASGNSAEFWYPNTPDAHPTYWPNREGSLPRGSSASGWQTSWSSLAACGHIHRRDHSTNWRPLTAFGAYGQPTYFVDVTPFLPLLADGSAHDITLRVRGQGESPTINSDWLVYGPLHIWLGTSEVSGEITKYQADAEPIARTSGQVSADDTTVRTSVAANRSIMIESVLHGDNGKKVVRFEQRLGYVNEQKYVDDGWVQAQQQRRVDRCLSLLAVGVLELHTLQDAVWYVPRLQPLPFPASHACSKWVWLRNKPDVKQRAQGTVGMDDWPGLRHAINGTGATEQQFTFTTSTRQTYFRDIAAKNDAWVRDSRMGHAAQRGAPSTEGADRAWWSRIPQDGRH